MRSYVSGGESVAERPHDRSRGSQPTVVMRTNAQRRGATHEIRHPNCNTLNRRSATGNLGCPEFRGLKPTATIERRSAARTPDGVRIRHPVG